MNEAQSELWARVEAFSFDDGEPELTFAGRLARENGWTREYAERVLGEYRRFMFLAAAAGHAVTPSDQVDQAWHLHLTYTRSYWEAFCPDVLEVSVHHGPTQGGDEEQAKYVDWYERTLTSYQRMFGAAAPPDVWPRAAVRFGPGSACRRVNLAKNWIVPKRQAAWAAVCAVALLASFAGWNVATKAIGPPVGGPAAARRCAAGRGAVVFGLGGFVLLLGVAGMLSQNKCPACQTARAMRRTGASNSTEVSGVKTREEWICKECGHSEWKHKRDGLRGGGGWWGGCSGASCGASCGGDSGCGGGCGGGGCGGGCGS